MIILRRPKQSPDSCIYAGEEVFLEEIGSNHLLETFCIIEVSI
jgi:hypothetical protein